MTDQKPDAAPQAEPEAPKVAAPDAAAPPATASQPTPPDAAPRREETTISLEAVAAATVTTTTGRRVAFRDIRRQLQEEELSSPGVQKLILEDLERAENECATLEGYIERYHAADKRAAVLEERLRTQTSIEVFFGVGMSIGSVLIGLAGQLWNQGKIGAFILAVGAVLVVGSIFGRFVKK